MASRALFLASLLTVVQKRLLATDMNISADCEQLLEKFPGARTVFELPSEVNTNDELVFLHIPKTGGTSLSNAYGRMFIGRNYTKSAKAVGCTSYWHIPPRRFEKNPYEGKKVFCVVRDPVDRAISEFKMRFHDDLKSPDVVSRMNTWLGDGARGSGGGIKGHGPWNRGGLDCHMVPQYAYVWGSDGTRTCDHVIRFENGTLLDDYNHILKMYKTVPKEKRIVHVEDPAYHYNYHNLSRRPLTMQDVSAPVLDKVRQYFWRDMCLFGYGTSLSVQRAIKLRSP